MTIAPLMNSGECYKLVKRIYGLEVSRVSELNGYDDKNFKVAVGSKGDENVQLYVLKVLNSLDSKKLGFIQAQNALLLHLGERGIICPQPQQTQTGGYYAIEQLRSGAHVVRLMKFIDGSILHQVEGSWDLYYKAGEYIATIDNLLQDFYHVAYETHSSMWMLDSVPQLRPFLDKVPDLNKQEKFAEIISAFEREVLKIGHKLPRGIIHGDFNEQNVVVSAMNGTPEIRGVLDFGDSQKGCYVYELAIAMTYMMIVSKKVAMGGAVLQGYLKQRSMTDEELGLLRICILARLSQSLIMGAYSAHLHPENAAYLLTTSVSGWAMFEDIYKYTNEELLTLWLKQS